MYEPSTGWGHEKKKCRKAIFNTEGSLAALRQAFMCYIWSAYSREMDLNILDTVF